MLVFIVIFIIYQLLCDYQNGRGGKPWLSLQRFITSSNFFLPRVVNFTSTFLIATSRLNVNMTKLSYVVYHVLSPFYAPVDINNNSKNHPLECFMLHFRNNKNGRKIHVKSSMTRE